MILSLLTKSTKEVDDLITVRPSPRYLPACSCLRPCYTVILFVLMAACLTWVLCASRC